MSHRVEPLHISAHGILCVHHHLLTCSCPSILFGVQYNRTSTGYGPSLRLAGPPSSSSPNFQLGLHHRRHFAAFSVVTCSPHCRRYAAFIIYGISQPASRTFRSSFRRFQRSSTSFQSPSSTYLAFVNGIIWPTTSDVFQPQPTSPDVFQPRPTSPDVIQPQPTSFSSAPSSSTCLSHSPRRPLSLLVRFQPLRRLLISLFDGFQHPPSCAFSLTLVVVISLHLSRSTTSSSSVFSPPYRRLQPSSSSPSTNHKTSITVVFAFRDHSKPSLEVILHLTVRRS